MASEFTLRRRVQFRETDAAGIMHFSHFFGWMEEAEHAFFRSLGFSIHAPEAHGVGWPRVRAACDYRAPLRFEDEAEIRLVVKEKRAKSLSYDFYFCKIEGDARHEVAHGEITAVCVAWDTASGRMRAVAIPAEIAAAIGEPSALGEVAKPPCDTAQPNSSDVIT